MKKHKKAKRKKNHRTKRPRKNSHLQLIQSERKEAPKPTKIEGEVAKEPPSMGAEVNGMLHTTIELSVEQVGYIAQLTGFFEELRKSHEQRLRDRGIIPNTQDAQSKIACGLAPDLVYRLANLHVDLRTQLTAIAKQRASLMQEASNVTTMTPIPNMEVSHGKAL